MSSKLKLIALFETSDPDFDITKLHISDPFAIERNNEGHNTGVVIRPKDTNSGYIGNRRYTYYRKDLAVLFNHILPNLDFTNITTHDQAITAINNRFGLEIDANEFEYNTPSIKEGYRLQPKVDNYEYVGQIVFKHATALSKTRKLSLKGFNYPNSETDKIQASLYSRNLDSFFSYYLATVKQGELVKSTILSDMLTQQTTDEWVYEPTPAKFNLFNTTVYEVTTSPEGNVRHVTLLLDKTTATGIGGKLTLSVPVGADVVPASASVNFTHVNGLKDLPEYGQPSPAEINLINNTLVNFNTGQSIDSKWTIVYNGSTDEVPVLFLPFVAQPTPNTCIIINGYDEKQLPVVLSYS